MKEFQEFIDEHLFELHECSRTKRMFNNGGIFRFKAIVIYSGWHPQYGETLETALETKIRYKINDYSNNIFYIKIE